MSAADLPPLAAGEPPRSAEDTAAALRFLQASQPAAAAAPVPAGLPPLQHPFSYDDAMKARAAAMMGGAPDLPPLQPSAVQSDMPAAAAAPPAAVAAPPDAAPLHAAPPNADELAQHAMATSQGYQELAHQQERAAAMQSRAIDASAKVQTDQAAAQAKLMQQQVSEQQQLADQQAARNAAAAEAQNKAAAEVDKASAAAAAVPFDPDHYTKSMAVGQRVGTVLALALGGIGTAFVGGPNIAAQMLQRGIDADIDAQKANYEKARNTVADRRSSYAMLRDQGFSDQQAQLGARQALASKYQAQLGLIGAQYAGPAIAANRMALQAQLQQTHADAQGKLMQSVQQASYENWDRRVQLAQLEAGAGRGPIDPAVTHQREMEQLTIPGLEGHAKTPEEHQKAVLVEQTYRKLMPLLSEMEKMRQEHGRNLFPYSPEVSARAANLANSIHLLGKDLYQLGVLSDSDNTLLNKVFPENPLATFKFDSTVFGQIHQFQKNASEARRSALQTWGFGIPPPGHDVLDAPPGERVAQ